MILSDATMEIALTIGMDGGKALLVGASPEVFRVRSVGPNFELPKKFAVRFYELSSGGQLMSPDKIEVRTDGLEFDVVLKYPRPVENVLTVRAAYLDQLPSSYNSSFVMTDETGNIFSTKVLSRMDESVELTLPANATTGTAFVEITPPAPATNPVSLAPVKKTLAATQLISQANHSVVVAAVDKCRSSEYKTQTLGFS